MMIKERRYFHNRDKNGVIIKLYALYDKPETKSLKRREADYRRKKFVYQKSIPILHLLNVCDKSDIITFGRLNNETTFDDLRAYLRKNNLTPLKDYNGEEILACLNRRQICDCSKCLRFMSCKTNIQNIAVQRKEGLR